MDSTSRLQRLKNREERRMSNVNDAMEKSKEAKLSGLPDKVLHHILSFLDTKLAVQTCVLGRKWKYLWQSVSSLHFNCDSFSNSAHYKKFVKQVLLQRDESKELKKFTIDYSGCDPILKQVTNYLENHGFGLQELCFSVYCDMRALSPFLPHLSAWKSLRTLKLEKLVLPKNFLFDFGSLTSLCLKACWLPWDKGEPHDPFRGCLSLKSLRINGCRIWVPVKTFEISAPEVTYLEISWMDCQGYDPHYGISLTTSKLRSFSFEGTKLIAISTRGLPSLEKVFIHLGQKFPTTEDSTSENERKHLIKLLQELGNAKSLTLSLEIIRVLSKIPDLLQSHSSPFTEVHCFAMSLSIY
ncbi:hypothetical protein L6164_032469 [Bauhinia variegata]|uniref:Uncharacterized protein n=1 Tax=Bauhinia variegata TaxID=167791 RepID=A0ACB9KNV9_BAUVA|nr:hypothetical protein L6164_032469 [Bauhinia variegata]